MEEFNKSLQDQINRYARATHADPNAPADLPHQWRRVYDTSGNIVQESLIQPKLNLKEGEDYEVIE